jgi:hypothetical protein
MVSNVTFDKAVDVFGQYPKLIGKQDQNPRATRPGKGYRTQKNVGWPLPLEIRKVINSAIYF